MTNIRAAVLLELQARADGKTRTNVACKPPNRRCGARCIPPEWDCRLRGEGNDTHAKAAGKGSDPLSALANTQRGLGRLRRGILTGNFSELEGGRRAVIRGAVKASPQDIKQKKELQAALIQGSIGIGVALAVLGGGVRAHGILSNIRSYREGIGKNVDDSVSRAMHGILDLHPGRARTKSEARGAVEALIRRRNGLGPIAARNSGLPETSALLRNSPVEFTPFSLVGRSVRKVNPSDYTDFGAWHQDSYKALWSTPRLKEQQIYKVGEGYYFASLSGEDFLRTQYKITGGPEVSGTSLVQQIASKLEYEHKRLTDFAKDRGVNLASLENRHTFVESMLDNLKVTRSVREKVRTQMLGMVHPNFRPTTAARNVYSRTMSSYDTFYDSIINGLPKVYNDKGARRSIPLDQYDVMQNAMQGHAEFFATRLYPEAGRRAVKGPYSADLVNLHYFQTGGSATPGNTPWTAPVLVLKKAASEHAGRPVTNEFEAIQILKDTGAFGGLQARLPKEMDIRTGQTLPPTGWRNARRRTFKFEGAEEYQSFLDVVKSFMELRRPNGKPVYKDQQAAEAAARAVIARRRMERRNRPPERGDSYNYVFLAAARADKKCGKSGIAPHKKCSKPTTAAAVAAGGGAEPAKKSEGGSVKTAVAGVAAVGAVALGAMLGVKGHKVIAYRRNVSKSALAAETMAKQLEREFREKAAVRLKKDIKDVTPYEASVYDFKDKGYDTGFGSLDNTPAFFGQTKSSKGAVVMLSYADDGKFTKRGQGSYLMATEGVFKKIWGEHDILPFANKISQPKVVMPDDLDLKRGKETIGKLPKPLQEPVQGAIDFKGTFKRMSYLRENVNNRGFNPDAIRAAAFVAAQRRLTGKPVHIMAYSNGGNVASETLAILGEMGYKDVKVVNIAGPTFGMFKHGDDNMRTWVSKGDEFYQYGGKRAFASGKVRVLDNPNIPHGLSEKIDPKNAKYGAEAAANRRARNSYTLDLQLQKEAYSYLTLDRARSKELVDEVIWRISDNKPMEGGLKALFGDKSDSVMRRYSKALAKDKAKAKDALRDEIEDRMLEVWYGGYNPNKVKAAQNALRAEVERNAGVSRSKTDSADRIVFTSTAVLAKERSLEKVR